MKHLTKRKLKDKSSSAKPAKKQKQIWKNSRKKAHSTITEHQSTASLQTANIRSETQACIIDIHIQLDDTISYPYCQDGKLTFTFRLRCQKGNACTYI